jgi:hypothetical protein
MAARRSARAGRRAFPSLIPHDGWRGREDRILMRNAYADFGVSVYGGLVAVWIVERDDGPIGTPIGARPVHRGHSAGCPRSHPASMPCSATMIASGTCRTARGSTPSAQLELRELVRRAGVAILTRALPPLMVCRHAREALGQPPVLRNPAWAGPCWPWPFGLKACPRQPAKRVPLTGAQSCLNAGPDGLSLAQP